MINEDTQVHTPDVDIVDGELVEDGAPLPEDKALVPAEPKTNALQAFKPIPIAELREHVNAVDQAKREIMVEGRDYDTIPGTKKPSLLKPGGEKLMKLYNLGARFTIVEEVQEHHHEYEYEVDEWKDRKRTGRKTTKKATGWYFYKVKCELFHVPTGTDVGDGLATASSNERQGQPANTVLKMAEKSAMLAAVLVNCNASDLFTQDMEGKKGGGSGGGYAPSEKQVNFLKRLVQDKEPDASERQRILDSIVNKTLTGPQCSSLIDKYKSDKKEEPEPLKESTQAEVLKLVSEKVLDEKLTQVKADELLGKLDSHGQEAKGQQAIAWLKKL